MTKAELADQLRQRQLDAHAAGKLKKLLVSKDFVNIVRNIPDDDIIHSYSTCSCCGRFINQIKLNDLIKEAVDAFDFLVAAEKILSSMHLN
jgi:hypothetical protein